MIGCNNKGASIMEVLVVVPLSIILILALSTVTKGLFDYFQDFKSKNESMVAQNLLRDLVVSSSVCSAHLRSNTRTYNTNAAKAGLLNLSFVLDDSGTAIETGADLIKYNFHVNSLTFRLMAGGVNYMSDPQIPGNNLQYGMAMLETSKISITPTRSAVHILSGLVLSVDAQNNISRCFLVDDSYDLCDAVGGHLYNDGTRNYCFAANPCVNSILMGFDGSGNPTCLDIKGLVGQSCPKDQFLVSNGLGDAVCTPLGGVPLPPVASGGGGGSGGSPPPPLSCSTIGPDPNFPANHGLNVIGTGTGQTGCFYNGAGVLAYVYLDPNTHILSAAPGPASDPNYPFSSLTVVNTPGVGGSVSYPGGASITYP